METEEHMTFIWAIREVIISSRFPSINGGVIIPYVNQYDPYVETT
jgi:hypothetical protein